MCENQEKSLQSRIMLQKYQYVTLVFTQMRDYCDLAEGIWEIIQTAGTIISHIPSAKSQ